MNNLPNKIESRFYENMLDGANSEIQALNYDLKLKYFTDISFDNDKVFIALNTEEHAHIYSQFTEIGKFTDVHIIIETMSRLCGSKFEAVIEPVSYYIPDLHFETMLEITDPIICGMDINLFNAVRFNKPHKTLLSGKQIIDAHTYGIKIGNIKKSDFEKLKYFEDEIWSQYFSVRFNIQIEKGGSNSKWINEVSWAIYCLSVFDALVYSAINDKEFTDINAGTFIPAIQTLLKTYLKNLDKYENRRNSIDKILYSFLIPSEIYKANEWVSDIHSAGIEIGGLIGNTHCELLCQHSVSHRGDLESAFKVLYPRGTYYCWTVEYLYNNHVFSLEKYCSQDFSFMIDLLQKSRRLTTEILLKYEEVLRSLVKKRHKEKYCRYVFGTTAEKIEFDINRLNFELMIIVPKHMFAVKDPEMKVRNIHKKADEYFEKLFNLL